MTLKAPFTGELFDSMLGDAVYTVAANITRGVPSGVDSQANVLSNVRSVMLEYLAELQAGALQAYSSLSSDNSIAISSVATATGLDRASVETILGEVEIDTSDGDIPSWFLTPGAVTQDYKETQDEVKALQPGIITRVANTILAPIREAAKDAGLTLPSLDQVVTVLEVLLVVAVLVGIAYAWRSFKK